MSSSLFIARLSPDVRSRDLEDIFKDYGKLVRVDVKRGYAFVEYEDRADAEAALSASSSVTLPNGDRLVVEWAKGPTERRGRRDSRSRSPRRRRYSRSPRRDHRRDDYRRDDRRPLSCYNCGREGHFARECTKPPRDRRERRSRSRSPSPRRDRDTAAYRRPDDRRRSRSRSPPRRNASRSRSPVHRSGSPSPVRHSRSPARDSRSPLADD